jgi:hypothetical protein
MNNNFVSILAVVIATTSLIFSLHKPIPKVGIDRGAATQAGVVKTFLDYPLNPDINDSLDARMDAALPEQRRTLEIVEIIEKQPFAQVFFRTSIKTDVLRDVLIVEKVGERWYKAYLRRGVDPEIMNWVNQTEEKRNNWKK